MLKINDILRASDVMRWSTVRTIKQQSVAEHTFNVVMIARAICREYKMFDGLVIKMALEHDLGEIMTGDIISPAKMKMKECGFDVKTIDPPGLNSNEGDLVLVEMQIVKAADLMESMLFLRENAVGRYAIEEIVVLEGYVYDHLNDLDDRLSESCYEVLAQMFEGEYQRWIK